MPDDTIVKEENETPAASVAGSDGAGTATAGDPPTPAVAETQAQDEPKKSETVSGGNEAPKPDWRDDRIRVLTAKLHESKTKTASLESQVRDDPGARDSRIQEEARALAAQQVAVEKFNTQCAEAASSGRTRFGAEKFNSSLAGLLEVAGAQNGQWLDNESAQRYNQFLAVAFEAGDAARLITDLGSDKQEFARILGLPPVKQAAELARRVAKAEAASAPEGSKLPKPIIPLGNRGNTSSKLDPASPEDSKQMSTEAWMKAREAQAKASWVDMRRGVR